MGTTIATGALLVSIVMATVLVPSLNALLGRRADSELRQPDAITAPSPTWVGARNRSRVGARFRPGDEVAARLPS
jgi:hypothetical protein